MNEEQMRFIAKEALIFYERKQNEQTQETLEGGESAQSGSRIHPQRGEAGRPPNAGASQGTREPVGTGSEPAAGRAVSESTSEV